jgi:hypothetical protein
MRFLAAIGALAIVVGIGAAAFFFGGYYSVAGTEDPAAVSWALEGGPHRSTATPVTRRKLV